MRRRVEAWTVEELYKARASISFPEFQRQPNLWSVEKRRLLIDSILQDIDIPKLYFNETTEKTLEVVDGTQRLWSLWEFIDGEYSYAANRALQYSKLSSAQRDRLLTYELQVTILEDADDKYLRTLFVRLQLGLLLVTGEKLNAETGAMKDFVFTRMAAQPFIRNLSIPNRRFAKQTLGAQIAINSFAKAKLQSFARTRYDDLGFFFQEYEKPEGEVRTFFQRQSKHILDVLAELDTCFNERASDLTNRSYILSLYLLYEEIRADLHTARERARFVQFAFALWKRLKEEAKAGMDRRNRELYSFDTMLSSAPGERYRIEQRHDKLKEYYKYYLRTGTIKGDPK